MIKKKLDQSLLAGLIILLGLPITTIQAQNENDLIEDSIIHVNSSADGVIWDMSFSFKTMNVFRGLVPSRAPVFATQAGVKVKDFILGFYGGASTNGYYTETDLILMYYRPKFNIRADWYYNFTEGITNIPSPSGFFDLNPEVTRGLLDVIIKVNLPKKLEWESSTLLYGRDRPSLPEDDQNGIELRRGKQRYSQYFKISYVAKINETKLLPYIGYSYSWSDFSGPSFYGDRPGFNDIGVSISRKIFDTKTISIPFKATLSYNNLSNNIYLVGTLSLIELSKI
ncbi:hypothetical protein [Reichenbachiella ulvae]|uniref:MetA-pathway of phenol degradation n=1 Tax=Reichenbachiella ulvae TaxID=2980104 RepID=A0ABT3CRT4_9BACT|nr:hypothetical protein [Reichenbachiella ulvae]MCV9386281.1 hypothetical protein [Reichenbachiella ulvae]